MYEFKIIEWTAAWGVDDLTPTLDALGREGWFMAHIHEVIKGGQVVLLIFMQRKIKEG